jgi:proteic killer suppression protein
MVDRVDFSKVKKKIAKLPEHIRTKLFSWAMAVEFEGIEAIRKLSGYHDEPLKGKRSGQRSIRLSRAYRAIYEEKFDGEINLIELIEVNKHEY